MADETPPPAPPAPAPPPAPPAVDAAKLLARIAELEGTNTAHATALEAAKKKQGELEADAALGRTAREQQVARIDAAKKALPADQQKLIDDQPSLEAKAQLVDILTKKAPPPQPPPPGGPPGDIVSFDEAYRDPVKWEAAKARDPKGAAAWFQGAVNGGVNGARRRPLAFLNPAGE